jgi:superfamily II DNA helicase RecQ
MPQPNYISKEMFACLKRYWGYTQFRPWQEDTILAILDERETRRR